MIRTYKSYFVVFFLSVFLFPVLIKEVHIVNHEKRFDCDVSGEQHLHVQHHDCTFCDFVIPVAYIPIVFQNTFSQTNFAEYIFPYLVEVYCYSSQLSSVSLRAPPLFS